MIAKYKIIEFVKKNLRYINNALHDNNSNVLNREMNQSQEISSVFIDELFMVFFEKFDFPDDLFAVNTACNNIKEILPILRNIGREEDNNIIARWELAIDILRTHVVEKYKLDIKIKVHSDNQSDRNTASGHLGKSPLYGMIRVRLRNKETTINYTHLIAHLHMAWPVLIRRRVTAGFLKTLGAAARRMQKNSYNELLSALPSEECSQLTYKRKLVEVFESGEVAAAGKGYLEIIIRAFHYEDGTKIFPVKSGNKTGNNKGGGNILSELPDRMYVKSMESVEIFSDDVDDLKYLKLQSSDGDEEVSSSEAILIKPSSDMFIQTDPQKIFLHMKGKENAIHMHNQMLPTDYSQLSIFEVSALIHELSNTFVQSLNDMKTNDVKSLLIVCIVLFYGRTVEEIINMRVYRKVRDKLVDEVNISYAIDEEVFMLRPAVSEVKWNLSKSEKEAALPVKSILKLKCSAYISQLVSVLWSRQEKSCKKGMLLSGMNLKDINKDITFLLNKINNKHNTSLSINKVYKNIYQRIAIESKDAVVARYITGQIDSRIASQANYTSYASLELSKFHTRSVDKMLGYAKDEFNGELSGWFSKIYVSNDFVGSKFVPESTAVKSLIENILLRMKYLQKRQGEWFIEYHNLFTAYNILMLDFSTGHRSINDKYCFMRDVDLQEKIIVLYDKGGEKFDKTRIAPLSSICCEQYKLYGKYRDGIIGKLFGFLNTNSAKHQKSFPKKRKDITNLKSSVSCHFFFLNENLNPEKITPSKFKEVIKDYYPLKLDTPRHYIRSSLKRRGLPGETVDLVMGHWLSGQNPSNRFSTCIFKDALDEARSLISSIMLDDGWALHKGPLYAAF